MTQKRCRGCGAPRDDATTPCPTCGYTRDPGFRKKLLQFVILFAILGTLWLLFLTKDLWLG